jgi:hypothetical protein
MTTVLLVAAAIAFLFWPRGKPATTPPAAVIQTPAAWFPPAVEPAPPAAAPDARAAIDSLLEVRDRLAATEALDEDSAKAVDTLWLDLLHGSVKR